MVTVVGKVNSMLIIKSRIMGVLMEQRYTGTQTKKRTETEGENVLNSVFFQCTYEGKGKES